MEDIYKLGKKLFPICRSITGNGTRKSLQIISEKLNLSSNSEVQKLKDKFFH